ncbi:DHA14-like major facilitator [Mycena kentingensis (nom. inval.)]|nr:DHA14-like major facilitator [Mycena kentingensis (nom. inval.)]
MEDTAEKDTTGPAPDVEDTSDYPHGVKLLLLMVALCLSVFLVALDITIIATAAPHITDQFKSLEDVGWYGSAYMLAMGSTQLLFGKFYQMLPIKWVYICAIVLFEIGSAICGAANSSNMLIGGRAVAGFGCAGIFSGAMIILAHAVPLQRRPLYTGIVGTMFGLASVAGPLMGGGFTTSAATWRWCFYINLPVGGIALFVMVFLFKMPKSADHEPQHLFLLDRINQFDPFGTLVFIPGIISLLLALQWGGTKYPWSDGRIIALFVVFGVLILAFGIIQIWKQDNATVVPRVFKVRSIWAGAAFSFCLGASFFIIVFYLPIWFQAIKGVSPIRSGIDTIPMILSDVGCLLAGALITVFGVYTPYLYLSTLLMSLGAGFLSTLTPHTPAPRWIGLQIVFGLGVGAGLQIPVIAAQNVLPLADVPVGVSLVMFAQTIGGALFISVAQNVFTNQLAEGIVRHVPGIDPLAVVQAGATSLTGLVSAQVLEQVVGVYNDALVAAFKVAIGLSAVSVVGAGAMEWKSIRKGKNVQMGVA